MTHPDFNARTWKPGDRVQYHDMAPGRKPTYLEVHAGLYWYSGLGCGNFFRPDGTILWCSPQEAYAEARTIGIEMRYVDSFINIGQAISVRD